METEKVKNKKMEPQNPQSLFIIVIDFERKKKMEWSIMVKKAIHALLAHGFEAYMSGRSKERKKRKGCLRCGDGWNQNNFVMLSLYHQTK